MKKNEELYQQMISELSRKPVPKYDAMVRLIEKQFDKRIAIACYNTSLLRGRQHEGDILQELTIRIYKSVISQFFCREGYFNKDKPFYEFEAWTSTIYENTFNSYLREVNYLKKVDPLGEVFDDEDSRNKIVGVECEGISGIDDNSEHYCRINSIFNLVLSMNMSLHIMLSWLIVSLFMVVGGYDRKGAIKTAVIYFEDKPLSVMFAYLVKYFLKISWFSISKQQLQKIGRKLLRKNSCTGVAIGDMAFKEFFQKKGGPASMSDWINRVDARINKYY